MATFIFVILGVILFFIAKTLHKQADIIDRSHPSILKHEITRDSENSYVSHTDEGFSESCESYTDEDDSVIKDIIRYNSWHEYKQIHPQRAKEIVSLGINLESKSNQDASEWIFAIETTAQDSNCKISELKRKCLDALEKNSPNEADWIYAIKGLVEFSKKESQKYNLKIGNTAGDMMLLFIFEKIKEVEAKYVSSPVLTTSDPLTLQMRFMLDSHDDVLLLQKLHIYLRKFPMTERNRKFRESCHDQMMSVIESRIAPFEKLKGQPIIYNMAVSTEIFKLIHDEILKDAPQDLINDFNSHLLSFHEEMEIISEKASAKFKI